MKKEIIDDWYVRIDPRSLGNFGLASMSDRLIEPDYDKRMERYKELCEEISDDVKRHVDNVGFVSVEKDVSHVCEYCESIWSEDSDDYNGGCCDEDEKNNPTLTVELKEK